MEYWIQFPGAFAELRRMYPLGRIGQREDISDNALFPASDERRRVTRTVHTLDGGLMAGTGRATL